MNRLKSKNAIITGAAGGQGRVACRMFAEEGARILASDLSPAAAQEIEALRQAGTNETTAAEIRLITR